MSPLSTQLWPCLLICKTEVVIPAGVRKITRRHKCEAVSTSDPYTTELRNPWHTTHTVVWAHRPALQAHDFMGVYVMRAQSEKASRTATCSLFYWGWSPSRSTWKPWNYQRHTVRWGHNCDPGKQVPRNKWWCQECSWTSWQVQMER